jgi:hypothetical protein
MHKSSHGTRVKTKVTQLKSREMWCRPPRQTPSTQC